jgi:hypothetical protein
MLAQALPGFRGKAGLSPHHEGCSDPLLKKLYSLGDG